MLLLFLKYSMKLEAQSDIVAGAVFITAIAVLPFWVWASEKTDKRRSYIYGMLFLSAVMITLIFLDPSFGFPATVAWHVWRGLVSLPHMC